MVSIQKSSQGITLVPIEARLLSERKIFMEGDITQEKACEFLREILVLTSEDAAKNIDVFINSHGGEINAGLFVYDVIQNCKTPIRLFCVGQAYSMASIIFACGNHGRYMLEHSELMLHEPLLGNRIGGNSSSIKSISETLIETKNKLNKILAQHTGRTEQEIEKATGFDHFFTAKEAIEFGLADKIVGIDFMMEG